MAENQFHMPDHWDESYERGFSDKLYEDIYEPQDIVPEPQNVVPQELPPAPRRKKRRWFRRIFIIVLVIAVLLASAVGFLYFYAQRPNDSQGHKDHVSTILIAGTDESGLRTDTLMLLCADRENECVNILSIPRDTKVNSTYSPKKINLAYQMNGCGEEGMYWLMDYVRQCVGFMPDGYVLVDLDCFIDLVDLFGGVEFDVPCEMHYEDPSQDLSIHLEKGKQMLDGEEAMGVVRFRSGYAMADLQRVNVQRDFIMAAISQWASVKNISKFSEAMDIMEEYSLTDLTSRNFMWFAWSALICGTDDMNMMTIPYELSGNYVCIDANKEYLDLINEYFNPYEDEITASDLNVAK